MQLRRSPDPRTDPTPDCNSRTAPSMVGSRGSVTLGVAATARSIATTSKDTANIALNAESAVTVISSNSLGSMVSARLSTLKISNNEVSAR